MNQVKDPVCGTMVDPEMAPAHTTYESQEFYFCSHPCRRRFEEAPARFVENFAQYDARLVDTKSFTALKFGSAASGRREDGPAPEPHKPE